MVSLLSDYQFYIHLKRQVFREIKRQKLQITYTTFVPQVLLLKTQVKFLSDFVVVSSNTDRSKNVRRRQGSLFLIYPLTGVNLTYEKFHCIRQKKI